MEKYGKIFKKHINNQYEFQLRSYDPDNEKYFEVISKARDDGFSQVIINSKIMSEILFAVLNSKGFLLKINMTDNTDQEVIDNLKSIIAKLKHNPLLFVKLKEQLEVITESGSIDISSIEIFIKEKKYEVKSNGIIIGLELESFFDEIIKTELEVYFS
ncbi:hypothetical protein PVN28_14890 [Bacillus licheniformis]|uniref:hypothetical protein n=1 Tax=Bacillus licheniformis TaxID=1402 RepID=UPI00047CD594|nr:hypothetical protein [Bacillus licheniformis]MCM3436827.1 hypothetical protein [Bacillus licheniformis]MDE1440938.1 hypothetical protein [Bacillus licheniformis]HWO96130.1 hypothetical protein [Bacillus sp. (in: firmicutes)]